MFKNRNKARMAGAIGARVAVTREGRGKQESDCLVSHRQEFEFCSKCKGSH